MIKIIQECKNEFRRDKASRVFSTLMVYAEASEKKVDALMNDDRSADILNYLQQTRRYYLRLKFIRENDDGNWVIRDKTEHVLSGTSRGREMYILKNK